MITLKILTLSMHFICKNFSPLILQPVIYNKSIFGAINFLLIRDQKQKSAALKKSSLRNIITDLECLSKFFLSEEVPLKSSIQLLTQLQNSYKTLLQSLG